MIHNSPIGILAADGRRIGEGSVSSSEKSSHKGSVDVIVGKNSRLDDNYNQLTLAYDNGDYRLSLRPTTRVWHISGRSVIPVKSR